MKNADQVKEWEHYYGLLQSDEARLKLLAHLKKMKTPVANEALGKLTERWLKE